MQNFPEQPVYNENFEAVHLDSIETYPTKPLPDSQSKGSSTLRFIVSVLLFVGFYYFFVSKNLEVITWLAVIVLFHELGHYFAMKIFKYEDLSIFFIPLVGAIAGGSKEKISQKEKVMVLLAGPVPGILIGIILFLVASYLNNYSLLRLSYAFVLINILNLLPIYPLDGGQLLKTLFLGSRQIITTIFVLASIALLVIYAFYNDEWFLLIIPYFLIIRMMQERMIDKIRRNLKERKINYHTTYAELSDEEYWKIREAVISVNPAFRRYLHRDDYAVSDKENDMINYIKSVLQVYPAKDLSVTGIIIFLFVWVLAIVLPLLLMTRIWMMI